MFFLFGPSDHKSRVVWNEREHWLMLLSFTGEDSRDLSMYNGAQTVWHLELSWTS